MSQVTLEDEGIEILKSYPNVDLTMMKGIPSKKDFMQAIAGSFGLVVGTFHVIDEEVLDAAGPQLKVMNFVL